MKAKFANTGRLLNTLCLIVVLLSAYLPVQIAYANISSCAASVDTHTLSSDSTTLISFNLDDAGDNAATWIKITRPSDNYTIVAASSSANGWPIDPSDSSITATGSSLGPGGGIVFRIYVQTANVSSASQSWQVQESDDSGGANPVNCSGDLSTEIVAPGPVISNVAVGSIGPTSITINWDTDVDSTSKVNYGLDDSYGKSSSLDSNHVSSHSVKLNNLSANTSYHFQVISTTSSGGTSSSGDSTFLTAVESVGVTKTVTAPGLGVKITNPADKTPPTIAITSTLPKVVKVIPTIKGTANDELSVVRVEYSTDGGLDWLPVDSAPKLGGKAVDFSFTPTNLGDGDYTILARAIDAGGNIAATAPITVVIDRVQPLVGGSLVNLGPQILRPDEQGMINTAVGVDQKITLSAVGGPTTITLTASSKGQTQQKNNNFSLTQSSDTGLWQGTLSFEKPGTYTLNANAADGAGNKTSRVLATVMVSGVGKVIKKGTPQAVKGAKVVVYYLGSESNNWTVWDGASYGQTNPQIADKNGEFNLFLPTGKYYLRASAPGYRTMTSRSFSLEQPTPISTTLALQPNHSLKIGRRVLAWPNFSTQKLVLNTPKTSANPQNNRLIGTIVPAFSLTNNRGDKINSLDWLGKPTLISLNATWSPETIDQLKVLGPLQSDPNINVISVGLEQTASQLGVYNTISGLNLSWLPDPDGTLVDTFSAQGLPSNYLVDRSGVIKKIVNGVLTKQQIIDYLTNL